MSALRNIREKKGFNLSQLASRSGISGKTLLEYEEGHMVMTLAHARLLAKALWVEVDELMPPPGARPPAPSSQPLQPHIPAQPAPLAPTQTQVQPPTPVQTIAPQVSVRPMPQGGPSTSAAPARPSDAQKGRLEARPQRASKPVPPVTEGQLQELLQLAGRLDISQEQLEERVGKTLATLNRSEATDWVKRLRAIADEIAPAARVKYGRWPDANEDKEAAYLAKQREAATQCTFRLFNGEEFTGNITDFTPYTITIKSVESGEEVVLRKLAIAYYRSKPTDSSSEVTTQHEEPAAPPAPTSTHDHERDDHHQPLDRGVDSDRVGEPETPERDRMDKDRGM